MAGATTSRFGSDSTIKDSLYRRLRNLVEHGLISRSASHFSIRDAGLDDLDRAQDDEAAAPAGDLRQLLTLAKSHQAAIPTSAKAILTTMDPSTSSDSADRALVGGARTTSPAQPCRTSRAPRSFELALRKDEQQDPHRVLRLGSGEIGLSVEGVLGVDDDALLLAQTIRPIERALRDGGELDLPLLLRSFSRISSRTAG